MSSAYILAERKIIEDASKGIDTTGHIAEHTKYIQEFDPMTPEEFFSKDVDAFGNLVPQKTEKEIVMDKARKVRELLDNAIANDEYEKARVYQTTLDALKRKYDKL